MRTPVFELHILPMIRATDRAHMRNLFGNEFDLWDYDFVSTSAERILSALERSMPTVETGGLWPPEWVLLFHRWMTTGRKRLSLGKADYEVFRFDTAVELQASGTFPAPGYRGWLQLEAESGPSRSYVLYFEPPDEPEPGPGETFLLSEQHFVESEGGVVSVRDATGVTELAIPSVASPF